MHTSIAVELKKFIDRNEACLVVGAGISKAACPNEDVVTWSGLLKNGIEYLKEADPGNAASHESLFRTLATPSNNPGNYLILAEYLESQFNSVGGGFGKWIQSQFDSLTIVDKTVIKRIDDLQLPIITTNYDGLIEQVTHRSTCTLKNLGDFITEKRASSQGSVTSSRTR